MFIVIVFAGNFTYAQIMTSNLIWPNELANPSGTQSIWQQAGSNICLDFHGDPLAAKLVIFSDGNHHMALQETVEVFLQRHPDLVDIFYATTPPNVLINIMEQGGILTGNLKISRSPDVFISPTNIMESLQKKELISAHHKFAHSHGNVLLVKKSNPKNISSIADLLREDVTFFISNPNTEKASYQVYYESLLGICEEENLDTTALHRKNLIYGEKIHHREAPQAIYSDKADAAIVYYHLALRYCRIFPDDFDFIPLGGSKENPQPGKANVRTEYCVGLINNSDNKPSGQKFIEFLLSDEGAAIYTSHGLQRLQ